MLTRIRGKILEFGENSVIIDVNGLGFEVLVPSSILKTLENKPKDEDITLVVYFYLQLTRREAHL